MEKCDNCMARPATKLILDSKEREIAEVCDECVPYYMRTVVPLTAAGTTPAGSSAP